MSVATILQTKIMDNIPSVPWAKLMGTERKLVPEMTDYNINELLLLVKKHKELHKHTPDAIPLEEQIIQPVFVYCNMMSGGERADIVKDICVTSRRWWYTDDEFDVYQTRLGKDSFPIALKAKPTTVRPARVMGQLFYVRSDQMNILDNERCNGVLFRRKKVRIHHSRYRFIRNALVEETIASTLAWMYVGKNTHWNGLIDGGYYYAPCDLYYPTRRGISSVDPLYLFKAWRQV